MNDLANRSLEDLFDEIRRRLQPETELVPRILSAAGGTLGVTRAVMLSHVKTRSVTQARCIAVAILRELFPNLTASEIGREIHRPDPSSVRHMLKRHREMSESDPIYASCYRKVRERFVNASREAPRSG